MKLYSPAFEKALKRGVRRAVRTDARLWKEYRRAKVPRRPLWFFWVLRLSASGMLAAAVWTTLRVTGHPETAFAIVVLWTLAAAGFLSALLAPARLHGSDVRALQLLPVSDFTIFAFRRDKVLWFHSLLLFDLLAGLGALACWLALPDVDWIGFALVAILALVFNVTLAVFVAAYFPRFRPAWISVGLMLLFGAAMLGHGSLGPPMMAALDAAAPILNVAVPTAWPLEFFYWVARDAWWPPLVGLAPVVYVIWSYRLCERRVAERFAYRKPIVVEVPEQVPETMAGRGVGTGRPIGVTAIAEGILSRDCLALPRWDRDWAQRLLWNWLTPREKVVANFIFPQPLPMVRPWSRILWHFLVAVAVWQGMRLVYPSMEALILIFTLAIPGAEMLGQACPNGVASRVVRNFGVRIPLVAPYPIGFHELARLLLKCTAFQLPAVAVIIPCLFLAFAAGHGLSCPQAGLIGLRAIPVFLAFRLALLVLNFASLSNDTSRSILRALWALVIWVAEIGVFLGFAAEALFTPDEPLGWLAGAALVASQYGFLYFYGWLYNRGSIDLIGLDRR